VQSTAVVGSKLVKDPEDSGASQLMIVMLAAAHEEYSREHPEAPAIMNPPKEKLMGSSPTRTNVWQSTFNPS
jgi:hypothetical protein